MLHLIIVSNYDLILKFITYYDIFTYIYIYIDNLPRFELLSKLDKISGLHHNDVKNYFMQQTDFKYYNLELRLSF